MKSKAKVWILVVTVVVAVGVGIGVWVHYDQVHDQETASLVDHAVSSALAGVTTQPAETTTEPAATEATATTTTTTKPTTTKKKKKKKHTTTQPQVVYRTERNGTIAHDHIVTDTRETTTKRTKPVGAVGEVIHSDDGDYWATNKWATLDPDEYGGRISAPIFIDQHGKEFIFPEENSKTRQYL